MVADPPNPQRTVFADKPGAYRLVITTPTPEIDPGEDIILEIYITGYGLIRGAKVLFYPPPESAMGLASEGPVKGYTELQGTDVVTKGVIINLGTNRSRDVFADRDSSLDSDVRIIRTEEMLGPPPINFRVGTKEQRRYSSTREGFIGKLDIYRSHIRLRSKAVRAWLLRKPQLSPLRRVPPGTHSFQVFLTYFNGKEWDTDVQLLNVSVRNWFQQHQFITWTVGILSVVLAFIALVVNIAANWNVIF